MSQEVLPPLARYAPYRRAGDLVYLAGIIAVDTVAGRTVSGYADIPADARAALGETGEMSVDSKDGPIAAQSWFIMEQLQRVLEEAGGTMADVVNLTQYFIDLRDFPIYNRIRATYFPNPPASTVVRVAELLPTPESLLEVQAVAYIPERRG
ncbi:MAG: endoribonuclease [Conexibacter sp.]|jgi:enamine deaminase RidA (YjgF/YER057c/UK114 family)|nr:endoribonuclease [Conexibacter sp.]MCZ4493431.1 endoribonuclease [Conexibacter sp.]MDX6733288.1 2-iminobutanoate/2-iminopropanoate deaminase [Baekduia sp.]